MTTEHDAGRRRPLRYWWVLVLVTAVVIIALVWAMSRAGGGPDVADPTTTADGGTSASDSPADGDPAADETATAVPSGSPGADEVSPTPGGTEPVDKPSPLREVPFAEVETVDDSILVEVVSVEAVTAGRDIPGETSGPAVRVVIRVSNNGPEPVNTSGASVNMTYGDDDRIPAVELTDPESSVLPASVSPGETADASYVFSVPLEDAGNVRIMVDVLASEPDAVFFGPRP